MAFVRVASPVCVCEFPSQIASNAKFGEFFEVSVRKLLNKQSSDRWFETPCRSRDVTVMNTRSVAVSRILHYALITEMFNS